MLEGFDAAGQPLLRPASRPITVRHLLTHTSGYTYSIWSEAITRYQQVTGQPDIATCQNAAFAAPLEFDPGERWEYGIGMDWVGKLVEQVSDQSLEVYFRENIFQPLGMKNSGFLISSDQKRRLRPSPTGQPDGGLKPRALRDAAAARVLHGRRRCLQHAARLHGAPAHAAERRRAVQRRRVLRPETVAR